MTDLTVGPDGNLWVADPRSHAVEVYDPDVGTLLSTPWQDNNEDAVSITADDTDTWIVFEGDATNPRGIYRLDTTTASLDPLYTSPDVGYRVLESAGDYLYGLGDDNQVWQWDKTDGSFAVVAGVADGGFQDGTGTDAWFDRPYGVAVLEGALVVADTYNHRVRRIEAGSALPSGQLGSATTSVDVAPGVVSTVAGSGSAGSTDGVGSGALLNYPYDVVVVDGFAYVGEYGAIRKVDLTSGAVTTFASGLGTVGSVTSDGYYLYAAVGSSVKRLSLADGVMSTVTTRPYSVEDLAVGPDGLLWVVDSYGHRIVRVDPESGVDVAVVWQGTCSCDDVYSLTADDTNVWAIYRKSNDAAATNGIYTVNEAAGTLDPWFLDPDIGYRVLESAGDYLYTANGAHGILRLDKSTASASYVAGHVDQDLDSVAGDADGTGTAAGFDRPYGVAVLEGALVVADTYNNKLRTVGDSPFIFDESAALGWDGYGAWNGGVNAGLGSYVTSNTDLSVATVGPELTVERTYNSLDPYVGPFGRGWTLNWGMTWQPDGEGNIAVLFPDGRRELHALQPDGLFEAPDGYFSTLASDGSGGYTLTLKDRTVYELSADHRLESVTDVNGRSVTLAYSGDELQSVTDDVSGRTITFGWANDRITSASTDPVAGAALEWRYYYDGEGRLIQACDPRDNTKDTGVCTAYAYNGDELLSEVTRPEGNTEVTLVYDDDGLVASRTDGVNNTWAFDRSVEFEATTTDPRGNATRQVFDAQFRLVSEFDADGHETSFAYDSFGNRSVVIDANGNQSGLSYDADGNLVAETNGELETTYYDYDADSNRTAMRDGRSASATDNTYRTSYTYDTAGNRLSETDPLGNTTAWTYSDGSEAAVGGGTVPAGLVLTETTPRGNEVGSVPAEFTTTYGYTAAGDLASVTEPSGLVTTYGYDELGRRVSETVTDSVAGTAATTTWEYDEVGNVVVETEPLVSNPVSGADHRRRTTNLYDGNGNLTRTDIADIAGSDPTRSVVYGYDDADRQTSVTDPEAGVLAREYDQVGNVVRVIDQEGRRTRTDYDTRNLPIRTVVENFDNPGDGLAPAEVTTATYAHDPAGRLVSETDGLGRTVSTTYDAADRPILRQLEDFDERDGTVRNVILESTAYDDAGNVTSRTVGSAGHNPLTTTTVFDAAGRPTSVTVDPGGLDRITQTVYDADRNPVEVTRSEDGRVETTTMGYDPAGRVVSTTVENGAVDLTTTFAHDERGNVVSVTDPRGHTTDTTHDVLGRPSVTQGAEVAIGGGPASGRPTTTVGYNTFGEPTHTVDPRGEVTVTSYDRLGRVVQVTHPTYTPPGGGGVIVPTETFAYDKVGNQVSRTSRRGHTTTVAFDSLNRPVVVTDPQVSVNGDGTGGLRPAGTTITEYDIVGNVVSVTDQVGAVVRFTYDDLNRVRTETVVVRRAVGPDDEYTTTFDYDDQGNQTLVVWPDGTSRASGHNPAGELVSVVDETGEETTTEWLLGRQVRSVDPLGRAVEHVHDLAGRHTDTYRYDTDGTELSRTSFGYDAAGNQTSVTTPRGHASGDVGLHTTTMTYDAANRLVAVTEPVSATEDVIVGYGYDLAGNLTKLSDGEGNTTTFSHNPWGLVESTVEPSTTAHPALVDRTWTISYDAGGLAVAEAAPGGVAVSRVFDELGRLRSVSGAGDGTAFESFDYDAVGNQTQVSHPGGSIVTVFDDRRLAESVTGPAGSASFVFDGRGRLVQRADGAGTHTFGWSARSELLSHADPLSGETVTYTWDVAAQPVSAATTGGVVRSYGFDGLGRLVSDELADVGGVVVASTTWGYDADGNPTSEVVSGLADPGTHTYAYDAGGRLTLWDGPSGTVAYGWDGAGNRTQAGADSYVYDGRNRLVSGPDGAYSYSARGTLASVTGGGSTTTYDFDPLGRLTEVDDGATVVGYTHDGLGRVAARDGAPFSYAGAGWDPVSDGVYVWSRSPGGRVVAQSDGTSTRWVGLDRHGDLTHLVDPTSGALAGTRGFDPFGEVTAGAVGSSLGFQADFTDPVTDHVWQGTRWYDGGWAGFLSRDTVLGELSTPMSLNRYTYAFANPLSFWDPDGRFGAAVDHMLERGDSAGVRRVVDRYLDQDRQRRTSKAPVSVRDRTEEAKTVQVQKADPPRPVVDTVAVGGGQRMPAPDGWDQWTSAQKGAWMRTIDPDLAGRGSWLGDVGGSFGTVLRERFWDGPYRTGADASDAWTDGRYLDAVNLVANPALHAAEAVDAAVVACRFASGWECAEGVAAATASVVGLGLAATGGARATVGRPTSTAATRSVADDIATTSDDLAAVPREPMRLPASETWGQLDSLDDHFARHGADFGARTANEYAGMASDFFQRGLRDNLPTRIDAEGVIRIYDPETNTFGAFNASGTTRTYFTPKRGVDYWNDQPGSPPMGVGR